MTRTNEPDTIPFEDVEAALNGLGIAVDEYLISVKFAAKHAEVRRLRSGYDGRKIGGAGDGLATVTTVIPIKKRAES